MKHLKGIALVLFISFAALVVIPPLAYLAQHILAPLVDYYAWCERMFK